MRFLKNKIAKANAHFLSKQSFPILTKSVQYFPSDSPFAPSESSKNDSIYEKEPCTRKKARQTKNIVKNFGRAICNFTLSPIASPYLDPLLTEERIERKEFINFVNERKRSIDGLYKFRALLIPIKGDTEEILACKRIFRSISEVFIKFFSVNWIFHGRIQYREAHLRFRFKMLRRIQHPESFTYLS